MKTSYILGKNIRDAVLSAKHSVTESLRNVKESAQDLVAGLKGQAPSSEETKIQETEFTDLTCEDPEFILGVDKETFVEFNEKMNGGRNIPKFGSSEYKAKYKTSYTLSNLIFDVVIIGFGTLIHPIFGLTYILLISAALGVDYMINKTNQTTS